MTRADLDAIAEAVWARMPKGTPVETIALAVKAAIEPKAGDLVYYADLPPSLTTTRIRYIVAPDRSVRTFLLNAP